MMTMLLHYAYCVGLVSSCKMDRAYHEDLSFRVLTGNQQPNHSRISEFRRRKDKAAGNAGRNSSSALLQINIDFTCSYLLVNVAS